MVTDNDSKYNITKNNKDEQKLENTLSGYLKKLEEYLDELGITRFDCSQINFDNLKVIRHRGFAVVYHVELQGLNCTIKRLKNNIY
ncbi:9448_t:CDS:2, partial [Racocetra persica]